MSTYRIKSLDEFHKATKEAQTAPKEFWDKVASTFSFDKKWNSVCSGDFSQVNFKWFEGAKLNITTNCLDRHLKPELMKSP